MIQTTYAPTTTGIRQGLLIKIISNIRRIILEQTTSKLKKINGSKNLLIENSFIRFLLLLACFPPTVTLIPGASTLSSPIQFRRSQDFYIVSIIALNCNDSLSIITQWTIKNCTSICSSKIHLDPTIITTFSELYIPSRTLPYGIYQLTLNVTMVQFPSLKTSSPVYVQITPSGITANLVQYGTSMITSGHEQDLKLDPGTYSVDPDASVFNATVN